MYNFGLLIRKSGEKVLKELYTAALGMQNQQTRLEVVANNIANASTGGFKRASVFERNMIDARANFFNVQGDVEQNDPPIGSYYDFADGAFQQTHNPLDLAIEGKGFFVVQNEVGQDFLTRSGNFRISSDGEIVTPDGKKLMGESGAIQLNDEVLAEAQTTKDNSLTNLRIAENGEVFVNDYEVGKLVIADVKNLESLQRVSNQNFLATESTDIGFVNSDEIKIKQGWMENSNVNIIGEMIEMIELQRMFEAGSKVIQTNDSTLDKAIALGRYY